MTPSRLPSLKPRLGVTPIGVVIGVIALTVAAVLGTILMQAAAHAGPAAVRLFAMNLVLVMSGLAAVVTGAMLLFAFLTSSELPEAPTRWQRIRFAIWRFL